MGFPPSLFTINGKVRLQGPGNPMPGLKIELWDTTVYGCIASTISDANGLFQFLLNEPYATSIVTHAITLHYRVYKGDILLLDATGPSDHTAFVTLDINPAVYDDKIPDNTPDESPVRYVSVSGIFTDAKSVAAEGVKINIYESGLREKILLTSVVTDINGKFRANISTRNIGASASPAKRSIRVEAVDESNSVIAASIDYFDWTDEIEVALTATAAGFKAIAEYDSMLSAVSAIDESLAISSLTGNAADGTNEIAYVAGATDRNHKSIELLVQAHKYGEETSQSPEFFYALCKTNGTDRNPLLGMKEADIRATLADAIAQNLIKDRSVGAIDDFVAAARSFQITSTLNIHVKNEGVTIGNLLDNVFNTTTDREQFMQKYTAQEYATVADFWTAYETDFGAEKSDVAQRGLKLITITGSQPEMIAKLMEFTGAADSSFHAMAVLDEGAWLTMINNVCSVHNKLCVPVSIRGAVTDVNNTAVKTAYAKKLKAVVQDFFPLVALSGKLGNYNGQPLLEDGNELNHVLIFIAANPSFDVRTASIHDINPEDYDLTGITDLDTLKSGLAPFQRLLRVTGGKPEAVAAMKAANIDSAEAIMQMSQEAFVTAYGTLLGSDTAAGMAYAKASAVAAITTNALTDVTQKLTDPVLAVFPDFALSDLTDPAAQPDLQTLFGSMDYCSCQECLSLYSPAAYMTDMLNFLRTKVPAAYTELIRRRPDLKYIDLTCKNTNTTLPYVDLVNELLELFVLKQKGVSSVPASFQTGGNAKDLAGYPEHVRKNTTTNLYEDYTGYQPVYDNYLQNAVYPYDNPFSLAVEETRTYLKHLGLSRQDAMGLFKPVNQATVSGTSPAPANEITDYTIYAEYFGLTRQALDIVVDSSSTDPWKYYGLSGSSVSNMIDPSNSGAVLPTAAWDDLLTGRLDVLLQQAKISYAELLELLNTDFLNKADSSGVRKIAVSATTGSPNDTCVTSKLRLVCTSPETPANFLKKLHRMIRLVRAGKMSVYQWDTLFRTLGITTLNTDEMLVLGKTLMLADSLKIKPELLACWWNDIDTHQYTNYKSETLSKLDSVYDIVFRNKQVVSIAATPFPDAGSVNGLGNFANNAATISALCRIREDELFSLLDLMQVVPGAIVSVTVLSRLYILAQLARAMGCSIADMRYVFVLAHITPDITNPTSLSAIATAVAQVSAIQKMVAMIKSSGFRIDELNYLLRNYDPVDRLSPDVKKIQYFYEGLRKELQKFPAYTAGDNELLAKLSNVIYQHFTKEFNCASEWVKKMIDILGLTDLLVDPPFVAASYELSLYNCFNQGQIVLGSGETMTQYSLSALYDVYLMVYKAVFVAGRLKMKTGEFTYLLTYDPSGYSLLNMPVTYNGDGTLWQYIPSLADVRKFFTMGCWIAVSRKLSLDEEEFAAMIAAAANPTQKKDVLIQLLSRDIENQAAVELLIGIANPSANDGGFLKLNPGTDYSPVVYDNVSRYLSIVDIVNFCRRTGLKADTLHKVLRSDVALTDSRKILLAAKGKYSDEEWGKIAKPLRDVLRRKQRAALVAYVIAHPDPTANMRWLNESDLFAYLLIDVEMDSCMVSSRIKQGISSIQLFIDRVLMGLEHVAGTNTAISIAADQSKQWETWRKWYRIWEANRKIFLYPENWIEPELRDDKSVFFEELETSLQQDDLTAERAQDAIYDYLLKLDETARMEPVGVIDHIDDVTKKTTSHVFARTYADPHHYFYRRLQDDEWTPWERVDIDIKSEHVAPVIWNNRLYLFWLTFKEKKVQMKHPGWNFPALGDYWFYSYPNNYNADGERTDDNNMVKVRQYEISLNWTEYKNGKWLKHKIGKDKAVIKTNFNAELMFNNVMNTTQNPLQQHVAYFLTDNNEMELSEYIKSRFFMRPYISEEDKLYLMLLFPHNLWQVQDDNNTYIDGFVFTDNSKQPEVWRTQETTQSKIYISNLRAPNGTRNRNMHFQQSPVDGVNKLQLDHFGYWASPDYLYRKDAKVTSTLYAGRAWQENILMQTPSGNYKLVINAAFDKHPLEDKFFFEDNRNTFFVRKMSSDKHLTNAIVKANEVNLSIAGYASSGIYENSGATPSHIDVTGITTSSYDGTTPTLAPAGSPAYYFQTFCHPHMRQFIETYNRDGIEKMLQIDMQVQTDSMAFQTSYQPTSLVHTDYPADKVDFDYWGAYSGYNWELFFHAPMMIAQRLSDNQQFEEARKWYHYIFDPTSDKNAAGAVTGSKQRFWKFRPFYDAAGQPVQTLNDLLILISYNNPAAVAQVRKWEDNPFKPHVIARMRILAYMKNVVMKYIDNLVAWGDQLFRRDTIESINEATQLYILAANILGKKPTEVQRRTQTSPKSFDEIAGTLDAFSNARVKIESYIDVNVSGTSMGLGVQHAPQMFYFCLSRNEKLMGYWDTVADRLFKIRNCMNIDGQVRQLPLFEPPIDPALLVRAAAAGLDINSVLNDLTSAPAHYRFSYVLAKANEFCGDVKALGNALLAALEKKDAEHLALLRSGQEISLLEKIRLVKQSQIDEANANLEALQQTREITQARYEYYSSRPFMNDKEQEAMRNIQTGMVLQGVQGEMSVLAAALHLIPDTHFQGLASGTSFGGKSLGIAMGAISNQLGVLGSIANTKGSMAATMAGYERRMDDWQFQAETAQQELVQIDKQILAAEIRVAIAEKDLDNHELQIDNARDTDEYMRSKFTNEQLYSWMSAQLSATYFQAYQLAYDMAKKAEQCYNYELPISKKAIGGFIKFGYWDSLKKGLLAGEALQYDLHKMEVAYMEDNERELELTKHVSLAMLDPKAILKLRDTGSCDFYLPEELFDIDYPGHYLRRVKSVSISLPCVAGPYTTINATLRQTESWKRKEDDTAATLVSDGTANLQAIATSNAQNDSGLFELNFRDERYLPFEGRGAVSKWELKLADEEQLRLFDFNTINDVVVHLRYTAREGGLDFKAAVIEQVNGLLAIAQSGNNQSKLQLPRYFSLKHEFATEWFAYANKISNGRLAAQVTFKISPDTFPVFTKGWTLPVSSLYFKLRGKQPLEGDYKLYVTYQVNNVETVTFVNMPGSGTYEGACNVDFSVEGNNKIFKLKLVSVNGGAETPVNIDALLDDLYMVAYYAMTGRYEAVAGDDIVIDDEALPVSSMLAWWKADAGITLAGGLVDSWVSQSNAGGSLVAIDSTKRPGMISSWKNGMPAIMFSGAQALRMTQLVLPANTQDFTVFLVGEKTGTGSACVFELSDDFNGGNGLCYFANNSGHDIAALNAGNGISMHGVPDNLTNNVKGVYVLNYDMGNPDPETSVEFNGTLYQEPNVPDFHADNIGQSFASHPFNVGSRGGNFSFTSFNIAELIVIPSKIDATRKNIIINYLKAKYNF